MANFLVNDVVENGGSSYICIQAHDSVAVGATGEPGVGATWTTYWGLVAKAGTSGTSGVDGAPGTSGTSGTSGVGTSGTSGSSGSSGIGFLWRGSWA